MSTGGAHSLVSVHPTVYADTDISIIGGTCSLNAAGKFYSSTSNKAVASVVVRQVMATTVHNTPTQGVIVPSAGLKYPISVLDV